MDEFPSMYSRPRLSRRIAPRPSTRTSGSKSVAHQSRMSVNGCQTNFLSAAINRFVFHSLITVYPSKYWVEFLLSLSQRERTKVRDWPRCALPAPTKSLRQRSQAPREPDDSRSEGQLIRV